MIGDQKLWILVELKVDSWFYPVAVPWSWVSEILNTLITMNRQPFLSLAMMGHQKFWILVEFKIDCCSVLLSYGPGDQKFWISPRKKAQWVHDLFHMKLHNLMELENWICFFLWTQLNAFFSPSNQRKPFRNANFFSIKYQYSSEFSQIGKPRFSLEGVYISTCVNSFVLLIRWTVRRFASFLSKLNFIVFSAW